MAIRNDENPPQDDRRDEMPQEDAEHGLREDARPEEDELDADDDRAGDSVP